MKLEQRIDLRLPLSLLLGTVLSSVGVFPSIVHAEEESVLSGTVTRIVDGDSIVIKSEDAEHQVQLEGIDAPEIKQPFGDKATKELESLLKDKKVEVKWKKKDDYQRVLGQIYLEGSHVNLEMLNKGLAWHFKRYYKSEDFEDAEKKAKQDKKGLWAESDAVAPWDYRKKNRDAEKESPKKTTE